MQYKFNIPTIEEIYQYFRQKTFFSKNGFYPRSIKNFDNLHNDKKSVAYLTRFQDLIKRNREEIDWKRYIDAVVDVMKESSSISMLGSFAGTKLYRDYMKKEFIRDESLDCDNIYNEIIQSVRFIYQYIDDQNISFQEYFTLNDNIIPVQLKHIYSGTVSMFFYACFKQNVLNKYFNYPDDVFFELFGMNKYDFIEKYILTKKTLMMKYEKLRTVIDKVYNIFDK